MKDGLVHVQIGVSHSAPCGARVAAFVAEYDVNMGLVTQHALLTEELQSSCGEDLEKTTCPVCMALVVRLVRLYRKATRGHVKWSEDARRNEARKGWVKP